MLRYKVLNEIRICMQHSQNLNNPTESDHYKKIDKWTCTANQASLYEDSVIQIYNMEQGSQGRFVIGLFIIQICLRY